MSQQHQQRSKGLSLMISCLLVITFSQTIQSGAEDKQPSLKGYNALLVEKATIEKGIAIEGFPTVYEVTLQKYIVASLQPKRIFVEVTGLSGEQNVEPTTKEVKRMILSIIVVKFDKKERDKRQLTEPGIGGTKLKLRLVFRDAITREELFRSERELSFPVPTSDSASVEQGVVEDVLYDVINDLTERIAKSHVEEAERLEKVGKLEEARAEYIKAETAGFTYKGANGLARTDKSLEKRAEGLLTAAESAYAAGKLEDAAARLGEALPLAPLKSSLHYNLALTLHKLGRGAEALDSLEQAVGLLSDPKEKRNTRQMQAQFATGEKPKTVSAVSKETLEKFNELATDPEAEPLCPLLESLRSELPESASLTFNLAKCAEEAGNYREAQRLLQQYLQLAPSAVDREMVENRLANISYLLSLKGEQGERVRRCHAKATQLVAKGLTDAAVEQLAEANRAMTEEPHTVWRLALFYESRGEFEKAQAQFRRYLGLNVPGERKELAVYHLEGKAQWQTSHEELVSDAQELTTSIFTRSFTRTTGYAYGRTFISRINEKLQAALALCPHSPEANAIAGLLQLQGNDYNGAIRHFDLVAGRNQPIMFYAKVRLSDLSGGWHSAKIEISKRGVKIYHRFWADGQQVTEISRETIRAIATVNNDVHITFGDRLLKIDANHISGATPEGQGPAARRFGNQYTKLFKRYLPFEGAVLGPEKMTTAEKIGLALDIASIGLGAYSGASSSSYLTQRMMQHLITAQAMRLTQRPKLVRQGLVDRNVAIMGADFKIIPTEPVALAFRIKDIK